MMSAECVTKDVFNNVWLLLCLLEIILYVLSLLSLYRKQFKNDSVTNNVTFFHNLFTQNTVIYPVSYNRGNSFLFGTTKSYNAYAMHLHFSHLANVKTISLDKHLSVNAFINIFISTLIYW